MGGASGAFEACWQVQDEQVDGATCEQRRGDRQALVEVDRRDDDEPLEADAAGHRLDGIEGLSQVQPRGDRARRLGLRDGPQCKRRLAARPRPAERDARGSRQAARPKDGVERREPGRDDATGRRTTRKRRLLDDLRRERRRRQRAYDVADVSASRHSRRSWSCRTPSRLEGRESRRHVRRERCHRTSIVEQVFGLVNGPGRRKRTAC
jgi:hypothetical protein